MVVSLTVPLTSVVVKLPTALQLLRVVAFCPRTFQ